MISIFIEDFDVIHFFYDQLSNTVNISKLTYRSAPISLPHPDSPLLVFDVEVCVRSGPHPILATALSTKHWYSWTSHHLINNTHPEVMVKEDLVNIGGQ